MQITVPFLIDLSLTRGLTYVCMTAISARCVCVSRVKRLHPAAWNLALI